MCQRNCQYLIFEKIDVIILTPILTLAILAIYCKYYCQYYCQFAINNTYNL